MKIQIIAGTTRPGRKSRQIAEWVRDQAENYKQAEFELVDVADYNLSPFDEASTPMMQNYQNPHTKKWSNKIAEADGYIFVTAEYNHAVPGTFKNAVDYLYHEWNKKSVGFVSYGSAGGVRAVENWRLVAAELQMADVREQLLLYLATDFENYKSFTPKKEHEEKLAKVIDQVVTWAGAMKSIR